MPTENRSSNTEQMVSVPREWVENYAGLLEERCAYEASKRVQAVLAQPPAQQKGEPVAVLYADGSVLTKAECGDAFETCCKVETPLYTHADAGKVERLRASEKSLAKDLAESLKQQCADMRTIGALRAQMTARDVLLREADEFMYIMTGHDSHARLAHRYGEKWWDAIDNLRGRVNSAISASAEPRSCGACAGCTNGCQLDKDSPPSAQVERYDRARTTLDQVLRAYDYAMQHPHKYLTGTTNWCAAVAHSLNDQARAALERKP